jgi:hypothetical protein
MRSTYQPPEIMRLDRCGHAGLHMTLCYYIGRAERKLKSQIGAAENNLRRNKMYFGEVHEARGGSGGPQGLKPQLAVGLTARPEAAPL